MRWFKFYGAEYLTDPKMLSLNAIERSCWLTLLCYASIAEDEGKVKLLTEEIIMANSGIDRDSLGQLGASRACLDKFVTLGMIRVDKRNGEITISNWQKGQNTYLSNAERQKRYRERKNSNATVTPVLQRSNAREIDREIERKKGVTKVTGNPGNGMRRLSDFVKKSLPPPRK
jgi:N-terminal phage replisome organiser (Phage_rep_org_N)